MGYAEPRVLGHHVIAVALVFPMHRITSQESPSEKVIAGVLTETSVFISH
jgi:hypothetical protein